MGLEKIRQIEGTGLIINDKSLPKLYSAFSSSRKTALRLLSNAQQPNTTDSTLEDLILLTLYKKRHEAAKYTTTEIAALINSLWRIKKFKDNVSRYFNQEFHPYFKAGPRKNTGSIEYCLSATGVSAAKSLARRNGATITSRNPLTRQADPQLDLEFK